MVGTTTAPGAGQYKDIIALLAERPVSLPDRVAWLDAMADALEQTDWSEDAPDTRALAVRLAGRSTGPVAGGAA